MPRIKGPGKFGGELDLCRLLYLASLEGGGDESCGDSVSGAGHADLMVGVDKKELREAAEGSEDATGLEEDFEENKGGDGKVHAVLFERTDGLVVCDYYQSEAEARDAYEKVCADLEPEDSDEE